MSTATATSRTAGALSIGLLSIGCITACDATGPAPVDPHALDELFRPASATEIAAVEAEWADREPAAADVVEEASTVMLMAGGLGTARVFSHTVDGHRHYGATLVPLGAAPRSLPVVVFTHGGDDGINVDDLALILVLLGEQARNYAYVVPSFRSERLTVSGTSYTSAGEPSPWDRDVDDALALLDVALEHVVETDPDRIGVLGFSRGGTVGLLMAIRDARIDMVSELAGPTDFLGPWMRALTDDAMNDRLQPLPGVHVLNDRFIQPLMDGTLSPSLFRRELVRRSPVLWADRLPPVQVLHGTSDAVVDVSQAESLIAALEAQGRNGIDDIHLYPGVGHNVLEAPGVDARIIAFLQRLRQ